MKRTGPTLNPEHSKVQVTAKDKENAPEAMSAPTLNGPFKSPSPHKIITRRNVYIKRTPEPKKHYGHASITQLNGTQVSPAKSIKILTESGIGIHGEVSLDQIEDSDLFNLSTPMKGPLSSSLFEGDITLLRSRTIKSHNGSVSIYLSDDKVDMEDKITPPKPQMNVPHVVSKLGLPLSYNDFIEDIKITKQTLKNIQKEKLKHNNCRVPNNAQATNHVRANALAQAIGLETKAEDWQFLHMIAHSLWGNKAQTIENFVLGKKHENGVMNDLAESLVKTLLNQDNAPKALYLSAQVKWVPGYEAARVADSLVWTLRDGPKDNFTKFVQFEFNPLSTRTLAKNEIAQVKEVLLNLFDNKDNVQLLSPTKKSKATLLSPKAKATPLTKGLSPVPLLFDFTSDKAMSENEDFKDIDFDQAKGKTPPPKRNLRK